MNSYKLKWTIFALGVALGVIMAQTPLLQLKELSSRDEMYSHLPLIPFVSAYFFWSKRKTIWGTNGSFSSIGALIILGALALYWGHEAILPTAQAQDGVSLAVFSTVLLIQGLFIFLFGMDAARRACFPLLLLLFVVPFPTFFQAALVKFLQMGSAEATEFLFGLTGVPFFRDGFTFQVPRFTVEVAPQCGGIRSGIALMITSIVAGQIFLKKGWTRVLLVVVSFPITVFKNGLRIVGLTLGALYIDPNLLASELHRSGGIPFFFLALAMISPVVWGLYKLEMRGKRAPGPP
jgi:exosortase